MDVSQTIQSAIENYQAGNLLQAESLFKEILAVHPNDVTALNFLGMIYYQLKNYDSAIQFMIKLISINPNNAQAYYVLGHSTQEKGRLDEAVTYYQKTLQLDPNFANAYYNLGTIFQDSERHDEAISCYQKASQISPADIDAYYNLGRVLQEKEQFDEAVMCYQKALQLNPNLADAYNNIGTILIEKQQLDEAINYCKKALQLSPNNADIHFSLAGAFLLHGDLKQGWQEYEWRWGTNDFCRRGCLHHPGKFSRPVWDGSSLEGKTLFIYSEQGVGDEMLFASCFQDVIDQAKACIIECDKRLIPVFSRSFPRAVFIEHLKEDSAFSSRLPQTDMVIPVGSLPKFLRGDFASFPVRKNYLIPDAERVQEWRRRFKILGEGLKVGISWRGGTIPKVINRRSITLENWDGIFSFLQGVHFINLQYGDCAAELREAKENLGVTIYDWEDADPLKDLDNFAAQISALDLVISVDNSTVHMAGALGVPVWVLLPFVPDWRWMLNRKDSPWYPKTRLFRQPSPGNWEAVMSEVSSELQKMQPPLQIFPF